MGRRVGMSYEGTRQIIRSILERQGIPIPPEEERYMSEFRRLLEENGPAVVFTGAGISEESGIPTFRTGSALWEKYNPEECCTTDALRDHPEKVWALVKEARESCKNAEPNEAHKILGQLEEEGLIRAVVTQNVDGLHQRGGSKRVLEIHGDLTTRVEPDGSKRPNMVLFGDPLPPAFDVAMALANTCSMMIVVGTSGLVEPAVTIPQIAMMRGIPVVEINPDPAGFAEPRWTIKEKASVGMKKFLE